MKWLKQLFSRRQIYSDLSGEIREHLHEKIEELVRGGMSPKDATQAARREFGNPTRLEETGREVWRWSPVENFFMDVRYGLRMLRRNPGFTAAAVLTLALGIGANTAIFTILNSVLLRNLPVKDPQTLVLLTDPDQHGHATGYQDGVRSALTYPEFQHLSANNQIFDGMLAADNFNQRLEVSLESSGRPAEGVPSEICLVSGTYFSVLGVNPILGRAFGTETDKLRDANPVAVISYGYWQRRFGGESSAVGQKIRILKTTFDVIGVAPPRFTGETVGFATDIWLPVTMQSEIIPSRDMLSTEKNLFAKSEWLLVIGRLKPGVSLAQANASINVNFQQYLNSQMGSSMSAEDQKTFLNQQLSVSEGGRGSSTLRGGLGKPLQILMGVVGLVLLIACANVANLLLARAASRQREIAVRVALGASASRLFRQVLTESILLAGIGGVLGLFLALWADAALLRLVSTGNTPVPLDIHPEAAVMGFTLGVSLLTGILFGLVPAFRASRVNIGSVMKSTSRGVIGGALRRGRMPVGKILVVAQVALSLLLLVVAGLFIHSFQNLRGVSLGYNPDRLLVFRLNPVSYGFKGPALDQLYNELLARIATIPGVRGATLSTNGLLTGRDSNSPVSIEGQTPKPNEEMDSRWDHVGPNYFSTTGIPILMGRDFTSQDTGGGQRVGIINQTFAHDFLANSNPIGRRITVHMAERNFDFIVVGVAADAKYHTIRDKASRRFYLLYFNPIEEMGSASIEVRETGNVPSLPGLIRAAVKQTSFNLPPVEITSMNDVLDDSLTTDRMVTRLSSVFGILAVVLSCIGIYSIMAYAVAGRTNEIGIRMALGAQRYTVLWMVIRESLLLILLGVAIGIPAVFGAGKLISSLLFGVAPFDPLALILATALMFAIGAAATYLPARRAMRVDPITALRYE